MRINKTDGLKNLDNFNLRGADGICHDCDPHLCDDQGCEFYMDYNGVQIESAELLTPKYTNIVYSYLDLKAELITTKGKARRKIRRLLKGLNNEQ